MKEWGKGILDRCKIMKSQPLQLEWYKRMLKYIGSERLDYKRKIGSEMHTAFQAKQIRVCFVLLREPRDTSLSRKIILVAVW